MNNEYEHGHDQHSKMWRDFQQDAIEDVMSRNEERVQQMAADLVREIIEQEHARISAIIEDYFGENPMTQEIIDLIKSKSPNV